MSPESTRQVAILKRTHSTTSTPGISAPDLGSRIELLGLSKAYGSVVAVEDVNLTVESGEFVALLGPSGAGKTTVLNMLAGFEAPSRGAIQIGGVDVSRTAPHKRNIGLVFQHYALFPHMTVAQNIGFPLRMRGVAPAQRRPLVDEALELVKLGGFGGRYPDQLSGGQQQRVALARAIVFRPSLLLMDEPLGALDKKLREHMRVEIKMLQRRLGATVIYVTHDQGEALTMADRVAVMNDGVLHQVGPPVELYERPRTAFVADFVGETNFLDAVTVAGEDGRVAASLSLDPSDAVWPVANGDELRAGIPVRLGVRPEWVCLSRPGTIEGQALSGRVVEILYEGATALHIVESGGVTLSARIGAEDGSSGTWALGDRVHVSWRSGAARAYPVEPIIEDSEES